MAIDASRIPIAKPKSIRHWRTQKTALKGLRFDRLEEAQAYLDRSGGTLDADTWIHGTKKRQVTVTLSLFYLIS